MHWRLTYQVIIFCQLSWLHCMPKLSDSLRWLCLVHLVNKDLWSNYDGDGNGNAQSQMGFMSKTTTLHVHHAFCTFLCRPCTTRTWNDQILSLLESGNGNAINVTFSLWTRTRSPLFSSNLTFLLSSDWVTWYKAEKVSKDVKSVFQRRFH